MIFTKLHLFYFLYEYLNMQCMKKNRASAFNYFAFKLMHYLFYLHLNVGKFKKSNIWKLVL